MTKPRFALRDLLWLMLIAAICVSWCVEQTKLTRRFLTLRNNPKSGHGQQLWKNYSAARLATLQARSREDLLAEIERGPDGHLFDAFLLEAVRRGWKEELQAGYQEYMRPVRAPPGINAGWSRHPNWTKNLEYLTAVRRSEGKPDPLQVTIRSLGKDAKGKSVSYPYINPQVENVDVDGARVNYFQQGGEDYEKWKVRLTNEHGVLVEEAKFTPIYFPLRPTEQKPIRDATTVVSKYFYLDARSYLRPPPTGRYELELFFSDRQIAYESDFSYRMFWKSEPVAVIVTNRTHDSKWKLLIVPLGIILLTIGTLVTACVASLAQRIRLQWKDWLALAIIALLSAGWALSVDRLHSQIEWTSGDKNADWSMTLAE